MGDEASCGVCEVRLEPTAPGFLYCPACSTVWPEDR